MSILDDLNQINKIKKEIHSSISNKNVNIPSETPFEEYPEKIMEITGGEEGTIDTTQLTVLNNTPNTVKAGDQVVLSYVDIQEGDYNVIRQNEKYASNAVFFNRTGDRLYGAWHEVNSNKCGYFVISDLKLEREVNFGRGPYVEGFGGSDRHVCTGPNGELITIPYAADAGDYSYSNERQSSARLDIPWTGGVNININGTTLVTATYIGEDIFLLNSEYYDGSARRGKLAIAQIDLDSGLVKRYFDLGSAEGSNSFYAHNFRYYLAVKENGNTYVYDLRHGKRYTIDFSAEDGADLEKMDPIDVDINFQIGENDRFFWLDTTADNKFIFTGGEYCDFGIIKREDDKTFHKLDPAEYPAELLQFANDVDSNLCRFNRMTNTLTKIHYTASEYIRNILVYCGTDSNGSPVFQELILKTPEGYETQEIMAYPDFSKDMKRISLHYCSKEDTKSRDTILMHVKTMSNFEIVTPIQSNLNSKMMTAIVKNDILPGEGGAVLVYKMDEVTVDIKSNASDAEISVTGVV